MALIYTYVCPRVVHVCMRMITKENLFKKTPHYRLPVLQMSVKNTQQIGWVFFHFIYYEACSCQSLPRVDDQLVWMKQGNSNVLDNKVKNYIVNLFWNPPAPYGFWSNIAKVIYWKTWLNTKYITVISPYKNKLLGQLRRGGSTCDIL